MTRAQVDRWRELSWRHAHEWTSRDELRELEDVERHAEDEADDRRRGRGDD